MSSALEKLAALNKEACAAVELGRKWTEQEADMLNLSRILAEHVVGKGLSQLVEKSSFEYRSGMGACFRSIGERPMPLAKLVVEKRLRDFLTQLSLSSAYSVD